MTCSDIQAFGQVLIISADAAASHQICEIMQEHALSAEVSVDFATALTQLRSRKFEAVVVDLSLGDRANSMQQLLASTANRTAVSFALTTRDSIASALRLGFRFVLERPIDPESIRHTLRVAYGQIVRERRRYFRYPVILPVVLSRASSEVYARSVNISEGGMALNTSTTLETQSEGRVEFTLPEPSLQITAEFRVCWSNERGQAGLSFTFVPFEVASELQAWLAQKLEERLPPAVTEKFRETRGR